jgi:Zn finger protein HypA/HybF involved in hydrogenase expression
MLMKPLPKDRAQKPVYKRCRRCRRVQKVHRATKYCPDCREDGHAGLMETIYGMSEVEVNAIVKGVGNGT